MLHGIEFSFWIYWIHGLSQSTQRKQESTLNSSSAGLEKNKRWHCAQVNLVPGGHWVELGELDSADTDCTVGADFDWVVLREGATLIWLLWVFVLLKVSYRTERETKNKEHHEMAPHKRWFFWYELRRWFYK